jgi:protein subunit release factor A
MDLLSYQPRFQTRFQELERQLAEGTVFANPQKASELGREHARLKGVLDDFVQYLQVLKQISENEALKADAKQDPALLEMVETDLTQLQKSR